ncbi:MAG TPA: FkbM family methyltransferase [Gammaproteobacteria bacterium]|jgi:FkbM family methyltransferase
MAGIWQDIGNVMQLIESYPLYSSPLDRGRAMSRFLSWQIRGRLNPDGLDMPFINGSRLRVKRRLGGRLHYVLGLAEPDDMAFVAHLLRPTEVFADVGANIGAYTVMAAAGAQARCVSFEPTERAWRYLRENVELNGLQAEVDVQTKAVGAKAGTLTLTAGMGEINHVLRAGEQAESVQVPMVSLDGFFTDRTPPMLIKIDVEGFETEVVHGARNLLRRREPLALLIELAGLGAQYGYDEEALKAELQGYGYTACSYLARERRLSPLQASTAQSYNLLLVRDLELAQRRVTSAEAFTLGKYRI